MKKAAGATLCQGAPLQVKPQTKEKAKGKLGGGPADSSSTAANDAQETGKAKLGNLRANLRRLKKLAEEDPSLRESLQVPIDAMQQKVDEQ